MVDGTVRVFPYETGTKEDPKTHVLALGTYGKKFREAMPLISAACQQSPIPAAKQ